MTMSRSARVDRALPGLFDQLAEARTPDYLEAAIERASSRPQRPAWTFAGRWLPVELTSARVPATRMPMRQLGVLALIAILVAAALAVYVGTHQTHLPAPFGLARNGMIAYVTPSGEVAVADPATGETEVLVLDPRKARAPSFSLDGTHVAYQRLDTDGMKVVVVDLARRTPVQIAAIASPTDLLQWSPDGTKLAWISGTQVWIANTDGSGAQPLDLGMPVEYEIEWRPPDGKELVVRGERDGKAGLFLITLDGSEPRAISPLATGEFDYLWLSWAPDGRRLAYSKADPKEVHVIDVDRAFDTTIHGDAGIGLMFPRWSPDGERLAVMTWLSENPNKVRIGVLPVDERMPHVTLTGPTFSNGIQHDWAPDGKTILATEWESSQPWLLDPEGGPARQPGWRASFPDWVEWQRLAP
jgi:lipoprotein LpqB-like beta-propeller protein/WD40 repeat protein